MKKLIFVFLTALTLTCKGQDNPPSGTYTKILTTGYDWLRGRFRAFHFPTGDGTPTMAVGQWLASGAAMVDTVNKKLYLWDNATGWYEVGGGAVTPAGNYGNVQLNRFGLGTPALDSFTVSNNVLKILHNVNLGSPISATAKIAIANSGTTPYIQSGPANITHSNVAWYSLFATDSVGFNNSTLKALGTYALRSTIFATGSNLSLTFKFGHDLRWNPQVSDSIRFNPQNSDGISAARSTFYFTKAPGYSGRSVVSVGTNMADVSSAHLAMIELKGSSGSNNYRIRSNAAIDPANPSAGLGGLAGNTSDILSDNALADSVDQYYGFLSTKGGNLTPHINKLYDFFSAPGGSGSFVDSAFAYFSLKPPGFTIRHVLGGPVSIDPTGLHTGPSEALEVYGSIKMKDGNEGANKIVFSDANGKFIYRDTTNLFPGSAATFTPTSTNTVTNKRWQARIGNTTSSATPTINTDNFDIYKLTAQTADITSFTTNLSGTPVDGDVFEIQVTGTAARAITWGASFVSSTVTLPTTTVTTATLTVIFQYYTTSSYGNNKWVCANIF